jgi:hypothetical protein
MFRRVFLLCLWALLPMSVATPVSADAHSASTPVKHKYASALAVPFGPGEVLTYKVNLGIFPIGELSMQVPAIEPTRGISTYRLEGRIKGGLPFFKVDTQFQSWIDIERLVSLRFIQDQHEGHYTRFREFQFYPEQRLWKRSDIDEEGTLATTMPLDELSFIYFARSLKLDVGKEYRFDRYFQESGNPVIIKVLRRDRRVVPAGTFDTIVLHPIIRTTGLFSEGGKAEIHVSDDARRILVYLRTQMPGISLTLHLKSIRDGMPVHENPAARAKRLGGPHF